MGQNVASQQDWLPLGTTPRALVEARLQLHWAAQVVSSLGRSFVTPKPDDSHPNLGYMADGGLLLGRPTDTERRFRAGLAVATGTFVLLDDSRRQVDELSIDGVTLEEAYGWLERAVENHSGGTVKGPLDRTLYDIPQHPVGDGQPFSKPDVSIFAELNAWYNNADLTLQAFAADLQGASSVRIWPHHFDIGALVVLDQDGDPETARSVGIGMTPGDDYYDEPYFYVNPYPRPALDNLPSLPGGGVWHQRDWFGAVLTGTALVSNSTERQLDAVVAYLRGSFDASTNLLAR